jgi:acetyltransferase-like isoleucine patch superfamily enzyme
MDINSAKSERKGLAGILENIIRQFQILAHIVLITPLYLLASLFLGVTFLPGFIFVQQVEMWTSEWSAIARFWALGSALAFGYFSYGFMMLIGAPLANFLMRARPKKWRGPYYSLPAVLWYIHNGWTYLVRFTFLEFVTPTPFNVWFYRMMGMKIGEGTIINSTHISDPGLIEMGRKVTVGGSVAIVAHYGQGGYLVLAPVKIGDKVTLGLRCIIMGGVEIGANAKILPGSVVLPKTRIPEGETWGGVPARKIELSDLKADH